MIEVYDCKVIPSCDMTNEELEEFNDIASCKLTFNQNRNCWDLYLECNTIGEQRKSFRVSARKLVENDKFNKTAKYQTLILTCLDHFDILEYTVKLSLEDCEAIMQKINKPKLNTIDPKLAYTTPQKKYKIDGQKLFKIFPKQDMAFAYYDQLTDSEKVSVKIYAFETIDGKRKFLVASFEEFLDKYHLSIDSYEDETQYDNHVYEVIRDSYPCRLYFDIEFSIAEDVTVEERSHTLKQGESSLDLWLSLVSWKLYDVFNLLIGPQNIIVLDSSTNNKFSKHVIFYLKDCHQREKFFACNVSISHFIRKIMFDISIPIEESQVLDPNIDSSYMNIDKRRKVKACYECLWMRNAEGKRHLIIDLGVYTRNRVFRLFDSSKYGKKTKITCKTTGSHVKYHGLVDIYKEIDIRNYKLLNRQILERSFIIPLEVFLNFSLNNFNTNQILQIESKDHLNLARDFHVLDDITRVLGRSRGSQLSLNQKQDYSDSLLLSREYITSDRIENIITTILECNSPMKFSPFPEVDKAVLRERGNVGGLQGDLGGWHLYCLKHCNPPIYKIKYQILNNKWCDNISRQHKSNHIMLEVDFYKKHIIQTCWDPECRGFRSRPYYFKDESILPSYEDFVNLEQMLKRK